MAVYLFALALIGAVMPLAYDVAKDGFLLLSNGFRSVTEGQAVVVAAILGFGGLAVQLRAQALERLRVERAEQAKTRDIGMAQFAAAVRPNAIRVRRKQIRQIQIVRNVLHLLSNAERAGQRFVGDLEEHADALTLLRDHGQEVLDIDTDEDAARLPNFLAWHAIEADATFKLCVILTEVLLRIARDSLKSFPVPGSMSGEQRNIDRQTKLSGIVGVFETAVEELEKTAEPIGRLVDIDDRIIAEYLGIHNRD